jgi:hypothetical protein
VHHSHWSASPQLIIAAVGVLLVLLLLSLRLAG